MKKNESLLFQVDLDFFHDKDPLNKIFKSSTYKEDTQKSIDEAQRARASNMELYKQTLRREGKGAIAENEEEFQKAYESYKQEEKRKTEEREAAAAYGYGQRPPIPLPSAQPVQPVQPVQAVQTAGRRRTRKQRGGQDHTYFRLTINYVNPRGSSNMANSGKISFYFNKEKQVFRDFDAAIKAGTVPASTGELSKVIQEKFSEFSTKPKYPTTRVIINQQNPIDFSNYADVRKKLLSYYGMATEGNDAKKSRAANKSFQSPAALRAFLLFTDVPAEARTAIRTTFCSDPWKNNQLSSIPAYTFLEALFNFSKDKDMIGKNTGDKIEFMTKLKTSGLVHQISNEPKFSEIEFVHPESTSLAAFCSAPPTRTVPKEATILAEHKKLLQSSYISLQKAYEVHLLRVFDFLKTIFIMDKDFIDTIQYFTATSEKPVFRLHPFFTEHPRGSMIALEQKITECRTLLATHYFEVESIYFNTLKSFGGIARGDETNAATYNSRRTQ